MDEDPRVEAMLGTLPYYKRVARALANKIQRPDEYDDLVSVAALAIWVVLDQYDPDKNGDFSKFCFLRVRGAMVDHLRGLKGRNRYTQEYHVVFSMDALLPGSEDLAMIDLLRSPEVKNSGELLPSDWRDVLTPRELYVVQQHFWMDRPLRSIGEDIGGVNEGRVSQILASALVKLKGILT